MLTRKTNGVANGSRLANALAGVVGSTIDRRTFLMRSGLSTGSFAVASTLPFGMIKQAEGAESTGTYLDKVETVKTICTHCAVGCTVEAEVLGGKPA